MAEAGHLPVRFGRFVLTERLAAGGMAEIFRATLQGAMGFEKTLVIKRVLPSFAADREFLRMFAREAKLVCNLEHPNIVQIHELGEAEGQYYIAMEYVHGIDGRRLWRALAKRGQRLPTVLALYIVAEVLKGLDYAHRAIGPDGRPLGVVHRDVSPPNILISFRGDVKLSDFGIALVRRESKSKVGMLKGKFGYMTPEQIAGLEVDHRSDLFAAGVVLAELLTGRRLFRGATEFETMQKVLHVQLDVLDEHGHALPPDVLQVLRRALQRDVTQRYQSAADFHEEIAALLLKQSLPVSARTLAAFLAEHVVPHLPPPEEPAEAPAELIAAAPGQEGDADPDAWPSSAAQAVDGDPGAWPPSAAQAVDGDPGEWPSSAAQAVDGDPGAWRSASAPEVDASPGPWPSPAELFVAREPSIVEEPTFFGSLATRTAAKVLLRFTASGETGLIVLAGPSRLPRPRETQTCLLHLDQGRLDLIAAEGYSDPEEVLDVLLDTFRWGEGEFAFYREGSCPLGAVHAPCSVLELIAKGLERLDELALDDYFEHKVGYHVVANPNAPFAVADLGPLPLVETVHQRLATSRPIDEVLEECLSLGDPLAVKRALYVLVECELADLD